MGSESGSDPMSLVSHVNRSKTGISKLQLTIPIELRARLAQAALDLGCSKLALIRAAIAQFLVAHEESRRSGQERALVAVIGPESAVPDPEPVGSDEPTVAEPEPEPVVSESTSPAPTSPTSPAPTSRKASSRKKS